MKLVISVRSTPPQRIRLCESPLERAFISIDSVVLSDYGDDPHGARVEGQFIPLESIADGVEGYRFNYVPRKCSQLGMISHGLGFVGVRVGPTTPRNF